MIADFININRFNLKSVQHLLQQDEIKFCCMALGQRDFYLKAAYVDNQLVGIGALVPDKDEASMGIKILYVKKAYRRQHIATQLLAELTRCAQADGFAYLLLSYNSQPTQRNLFLQSIKGEEKLKSVDFWYVTDNTHIDKLLTSKYFQSKSLTQDWQVEPLSHFSAQLSAEEVESYLEKEKSLRKPDLFEQDDVYFPPICKKPDDENYSFIIMDKAKPVAWILVRREEDDKEGDKLVIYGFYVEPEYHKKHLFYVLARHILELAKEVKLPIYWRIMRWSPSFLKICDRHSERWGFSGKIANYLKIHPMIQD